jgi:iron-sulfur cluster repair protein YtfE (RIC family)
MSAKNPKTDKVVRVPKSPISGTYPAGTARQREEHHQLNGWVEALRVDDPVELKTALKGMRRFLLEHFAHEEADDGLFPLLRDTYGRERQLEALRHEHREMLARMDRLQGLLTPAIASVDEMTRHQIDELVCLVEAHEEWENALLQEALITDIGVGD